MEFRVRRVVAIEHVSSCLYQTPLHYRNLSSDLPDPKPSPRPQPSTINPQPQPPNPEPHLKPPAPNPHTLNPVAQFSVCSGYFNYLDNNTNAGHPHAARTLPHPQKFQFRPVLQKDSGMRGVPGVPGGIVPSCI